MNSAATRLLSLPINKREREKYMQKCLHLAQDCRADIFMDFYQGDQVVLQLRGAMTAIHQDSLLIFIRDHSNFHVVKNMDVHAYFTLRMERKSLPCDFTTKVISLEREGLDHFLVLAKPETMGHSQRRYNVRIPISKDEIDNFRVWYGQHGTVKNPKAAVRWTSIAPEDVQVLDISAGGMKVGLARRCEASKLVTKESDMLISGDFTTKDKNTPLLMAGKVLRVEDEQHQPFLFLGIGYQQWARVNPEGLQWVTMSMEEGVSPLASWVFQSIMERYRLRDI